MFPHASTANNQSSDGICNLEDERKTAFIQAKSSSGARCFSVLIGSDVTDPVKEFSDKRFFYRQHQT
jgi:hypothetical protein